MRRRGICGTSSVIHSAWNVYMRGRGICGASSVIHSAWNVYMRGRGICGASSVIHSAWNVYMRGRGICGASSVIHSAWNVYMRGGAYVAHPQWFTVPKMCTCGGGAYEAHPQWFTVPELCTFGGGAYVAHPQWFTVPEMCTCGGGAYEAHPQWFTVPEMCTCGEGHMWRILSDSQCLKCVHAGRGICGASLVIHSAWNVYNLENIKRILSVSQDAVIVLKKRYSIISGTRTGIPGCTYNGVRIIPTWCRPNQGTSPPCPAPSYSYKIARRGLRTWRHNGWATFTLDALNQGHRGYNVTLFGLQLQPESLLGKSH